MAGFNKTLPSFSMASGLQLIVKVLMHRHSDARMNAAAIVYMMRASCQVTHEKLHYKLREGGRWGRHLNDTKSHPSCGTQQGGFVEAESSNFPVDKSRNGTEVF